MAQENRFLQFWEESPERIFPDWSDDIDELIYEASKPDSRRVEVILDKKDGMEFLSLYDYQGNGLADDLGGSGTVALMSPETLIRRYRKQMKDGQPVFRFYRIACSVADVLGMRHPVITTAPNSRFSPDSWMFCDLDHWVIYLREGTLESADVYFELCFTLRMMWQMHRFGTDNVPDPNEEETLGSDEYSIDRVAFAAMMMEVLFEIVVDLEMLNEDIYDRVLIRKEELEEEYYG